MVAGGPKTDPRCSRPGIRGTLYPELFRSASIRWGILAPAAKMRQQPWHHLHEACAGIASSLKRFSVRCCYEGITGCGYVESWKYPWRSCTLLIFTLASESEFSGCLSTTLGQGAQNEARRHCDTFSREARNAKHSVHLQQRRAMWW